MSRIIPLGKLPNEILKAVLAELSTAESSVAVGPGVGEDAAVLDINGASCIAVTADPITFAADRLGFYAVTVNANDIATTGGLPKWFFPTLLFPTDTSEDTVRRVFSELGSAASAIGVTVSGGHTEITAAVTRPVVCGAMIGVVREGELKDKAAIKTGDGIVMTKTAGNEGTAILAADFAERLARSGVGRQELQTALGFLKGLSILPEARIAAETNAVRAMHDITEGGVATALIELSAASGCGVDVDLDEIPIDPATKTICSALGLDPLGLIGSGSLLTVIEGSAAEAFIQALSENGIAATRIGRITDRGGEAVATSGGVAVDFPQFAADEIAKMFG